MVGIVAAGAYVPFRRLQRAAVYKANAWFAPGLKSLARGERAIANWDEDAITMAVEAARDCLAERDRSGISAISLASTTAPFADRQNAGLVKEALNLPDSVGAADLGGSQRAGTTALLQALNMAGASDGAILCTASDKRLARPASEAELINADAAAALLVGKEDGGARFLGGHSISIDFVDHFRGSGESFDYSWESRWVRDEGLNKLIPMALEEAMARYEVKPETIDRLIVPVPVRGVPESVARRTGIRAEAVCDGLGEPLGNAGVAHPLVMLVHALETARPGERIALVGFGQGCDVLFFEATELVGQVVPGEGVDGWLARRMPDENYLRYLFFNGNLMLDRGMRAEANEKQPLTSLYRHRKTVFGLVGGRCTKTGTVQFPKSDISVNPNDHAVSTQEDYPLAERAARIVTFTADVLTYSPDPPAYYGMIEFEGGGRMVASFTDIPGKDSISVGGGMRMMFRIKAVDEPRAFPKYFWKAVPIQ